MTAKYNVRKIDVPSIIILLFFFVELTFVTDTFSIKKTGGFGILKLMGFSFTYLEVIILLVSSIVVFITRSVNKFYLATGFLITFFLCYSSTEMLFLSGHETTLVFYRRYVFIFLCLLLYLHLHKNPELVFRYVYYGSSISVLFILLKLFMGSDAAIKESMYCILFLVGLIYAKLLNKNVKLFDMIIFLAVGLTLTFVPSEKSLFIYLIIQLLTITLVKYGLVRSIIPIILIITILVFILRSNISNDAMQILLFRLFKSDFSSLMEIYYFFTQIDFALIESLLSGRLYIWETFLSKAHILPRFFIDPLANYHPGAGAHNLYIELYFRLGIIGSIFLFIIFIVSLWRSIRLMKDPTLKAAVIGWLIGAGIISVFAGSFIDSSRLFIFTLFIMCIMKESHTFSQRRNL